MERERTQRGDDGHDVFRINDEREKFGRFAPRLQQPAFSHRFHLYHGQESRRRLVRLVVKKPAFWVASDKSMSSKQGVGWLFHDPNLIGCPCVHSATPPPHHYENGSTSGLQLYDMTQWSYDYLHDSTIRRLYTNVVYITLFTSLSTDMQAFSRQTHHAATAHDKPRHQKVPH